MSDVKAQRNRAAARRYHAKAQASDAAYRRRNVERARRWREEHPDRHRAHARESARRRWPSRKGTTAERDRAAQANAVRRMRKTGAFVERVFRSVVWRRDGGICGICSLPADPADWHLDHIKPLARGGEHSYANTQVAHPSCNWSKGGRA